MIRFVLLGLLFASHLKAEITYKVALHSLPQRVSPFYDTLSPTMYISRQVFWPIFEKNDKNQFTSKFLDMQTTKSLNDQWSSYQLCLKENLKFSDNSLITPLDLQKSLEKIHSLNKAIYNNTKTEVSKNCVVVSFTSPNLDYFDQLSGFSATIISANSLEKEIEIGMGAFKVIKRKNDYIQLQRSDFSTPSNIQIVDIYQQDKIPLSELSEIDDWNLSISPEAKEYQKNEKFKKVPTPLGRTSAILNRANDKIRKPLAACLQKHKKLFYDLSSVENKASYDYLLHPNYPGSKVELPIFNCTNMSNKQPIESTFVYVLENVKAAKLLVENINATKTLHIKFENLKPAETSIKLKSTDNNFFVTLSFEAGGTIGAEGLDPYSIFNNFFGKSSLIPGGVPEIEKLMSQTRGLKNTQELEVLYKKAHKYLIEEGFVVPLALLPVVHNYPKDIDNINFIDRFSGIPKIYEMVRNKK